MPASPPRLELSTRDGVSIAHFTDRRILDELAIQEIESGLLGLVRNAKSPVKLVLDFAVVEHLSSAALGMLITLNKEVGGRKGRLVLADIRPQILEVFKITRLNKLFDIQASVDDACQALAS